MDVPKSHPRYESLILREKVKECLKEGIISEVGIAAHGRGEAFDYFIGETTTEEANKAIKAAAIMLCRADNPVISVSKSLFPIVAYITEVRDDNPFKFVNEVLLMVK